MKESRSISTPFGRFARPLRAVTFLAPKLFWFYEYLCCYLEKKLHNPITLSVGSSYDELPGEVDLAFLCGLPYIELVRRDGAVFEPIAAPILMGKRYEGRPVYFSDVVVRRNSRFQSFADLRGCVWAYNEPHSQSGYGITRFHLVQCAETNGYFGRVVESGFHERAVQTVLSGEVDASAIDSHVLALMIRDEPVLLADLRIIASFGPSTIQPIVVAQRLPSSLRDELRRALLEIGNDALARPVLHRAMVQSFDSVTDSSYADIRMMLAATESANYSTIR
ncbi:MAG: phosphate/phosphite/phosphonate ABC transporter substrate-binding protein [Gemmataceae bacterium]